MTSEPAIERVAAACPSSKFKDDRHEWEHIMCEDGGLMPRSDRWWYALQKCTQCDLHVLRLCHPQTRSCYTLSPSKLDIIMHAFYMGSTRP